MNLLKWLCALLAMFWILFAELLIEWWINNFHGIGCASALEFLLCFIVVMRCGLCSVVNNDRVDFVTLLNVCFDVFGRLSL